MKTPTFRPALLGFVFSFAASPIFAAAPAVVEESSAPFVEGSISVSGGGTFLDGNRAAFEQRFRTEKSGFGGLESLRYRREGDHSSFALDSHLIAGDADYGLSGQWTYCETSYVDFGYRRYRIFYDGSGGYFAPSASFFPIYDDKLHVDRERLWLEIGFKPTDLPRLKLRYERLTRQGLKPSSEWGDTNLTGNRGARAIVPSFLELDEARDIVSLDANHETDDSAWVAGLRYERTALDNARQNFRRPQEPAARAVTTTDVTSSDLFSAHGYYERRFSPRLLASAGAITTALDTNIEGDRIYGPDYNPVFNPLLASRQPADLGFLDLTGGTRLKQHVFNLTAVHQPSEHWRIRPAIRYENLQTDGMSSFIATNVANNLATTQLGSEAVSEKQEDKLTGTLEVRYTGRPAWSHSFRAEWNHAAGDLEETLFNSATRARQLDRLTDYTRTAQKYALASQWYARPGLTFTSEYYYKLRLNDYDAVRDSTSVSAFDRYPVFITNQDFATHDFNLRTTWRAAPTLSFVTRYDLQYSTITTSFIDRPEIRNARQTAHIISESVSWTPHTRLYVLASGNLTYDQLATPAAPFILNSDNNYLNASLSAGYVLSEKTDLVLDANHYSARNFADNSAISLPYGADQKTESVSLTAVIRQSEHLVCTLKYRYAEHTDLTAGHRNDFRAHSVYAKTEYSF